MDFTIITVWVQYIYRFPASHQVPSDVFTAGDANKPD